MVQRLEVLWASAPALVTNADGRLEVFARCDDSRLNHIWQVSPNGAWSDWEQLGDWFITDAGRTLLLDGDFIWGV